MLFILSDLEGSRSCIRSAVVALARVGSFALGGDDRVHFRRCCSLAFLYVWRRGALEWKESACREWEAQLAAPRSGGRPGARGNAEGAWTRTALRVQKTLNAPAGWLRRRRGWKAGERTPAHLEGAEARTSRGNRA